MKRLAIFLVLLGIGCVEPYDFEIVNDKPTYVIEGSISDKSFNETLEYPSDGRFFSVKVSLTGNVTNRRPTPVTSASVMLIDSNGNEWQYVPASEKGKYILDNKEFKAIQGVEYRLMVAIGEVVFESEWVKLPAVQTPEIGTVDFIESTKQTYVKVASKDVLTTIDVINARININPKNTNEVIYYKWTYDPIWIYKAPLNPSSIDPGNTCWATDKNYLNTYTLQTDHAGGYARELFTIPTVRNERIFENFSVLVIQHVLNPDYYFFWKEMSDQNSNSTLMTTPPFNLKTNLFSNDDTQRASGYFDVVQEQATRWYFTKDDLSYYVVNTLRGDCLIEYGPDGPAPECLDCREYSFGQTTNVQPSWWRY